MTEEDNILKLFSNSYKGERFTTGTISVKPFKHFFDSDTRLVQDCLLNSFPIHNGYIRVNENLITTLNDDAPVHVNYDVGNPIL